jgi:hypothetical protein
VMISIQCDDVILTSLAPQIKSFDFSTNLFSMTSLKSQKEVPQVVVRVMVQLIQ